MSGAVSIKRAYEAATADDGYRVLVDRLWPRGVRKGALRIHAWERELAPSTRLRSWFGHDPKRWDEFVRRYRTELQESAAREKIQELARRAASGRVTLVFGAHDTEHSNAMVLKDEIEHELEAGSHPHPA